ncbi:MAG: MarR family transcriptional regulator [Pseudomonadota bacterium]
MAVEDQDRQQLTARTKKKSDAGVPSDSVFTKVLTEVAMIANLASNEFDSILPKGLTEAQYGVLNRLIRLNKDETIGQLATAFQVAQPTMSSTVRKLENKNLVRILPDPDDRRIKYVSVTSDGQKIRTETVKALRPFFAVFEETAPDQDWESCLESLYVLRTFLEDRRKP